MSDPAFRGTMLLLQNRTKRDPESYREEFLQQLAHFDAHSKAMATSSKQHSNEQYLAVLAYICNVSHCYPKNCAHVPGVLISTLKNGKNTLDPDTRIELVKNLILLRSRGIVQPDQTLPVFFELLMLREKALRKLILSHIVSDIKRVNLPGAKNGAAVNKKIQNFLFGLMKDDDATQAYCALLVVIDLYRRHIWTEERAVEVIAEACFSRHSKILRVALRFFMMQMPKVSAMESDEEEDPTDVGRVISKMKQKIKVKAKTRSRLRVLERDKNKLIKKYDKEAKAEADFQKQHVDPIRFLRDPQGFCERLFGKLQKTSERFETRILYLHVLSRVIGEHEVIVLSLYPYLERYMEPTQLHSTQLLALAASCVHKMVPPDAVEPLVKTIADHFVNDRSDPDMITIGINTIREICKRQPLAMTKPLLADLCEYKSHRGHRGVIMAARALIQLYRGVAADMLPNKLRGGKGAPSGATSDQIRYGAAAPFKDIPGMELLLEHLGELPPKPEDLEEGGSDGGSDAEFSSADGAGDGVDDDDDGSESSGSGSWVNVSHSDSDNDSLFSQDDDEEGEEGSDSGSDSGESCPELVPAAKAIVSPYTGRAHAVLRADEDPDVWEDDGSGDDREEEEPAAPPATKRARGSAAKAALPQKRTKKEPLPQESEGSDDESDDEEEEEGEWVEASSESDEADEEAADSDVEEGEWTEDDGEEEEEGDESDESDESDEEEKGKASSDDDEDGGAFFEDVEVGSSATAASKPASVAPSNATTTLSATRLLTDADFAKMRQLMLQKATGADHRSLRGKKKDEAERQQKRHQLLYGVTADLQPSLLETFTTRKREADKEAKVAKAIETREEKAPYNARKKSKAKLYSTNVEKAKRGKLFQMTKRSARVAQKIKRSTSERGDRRKEMKQKDVKFRIRRGWKA